MWRRKSLATAAQNLLVARVMKQRASAWQKWILAVAGPSRGRNLSKGQDNMNYRLIALAMVAGVVPDAQLSAPFRTRSKPAGLASRQVPSLPAMRRPIAIPLKARRPCKLARRFQPHQDPERQHRKRQLQCDHPGGFGLSHSLHHHHLRPPGCQGPKLLHGIAGRRITCITGRPHQSACRTFPLFRSKRARH